MRQSFLFASAMGACFLAGCGGGGGGEGGSSSRAVLQPPATRNVGSGFDANGNPVYGVQVANGIRTIGLGDVRTTIPVSGLPETFNVVYGNLIVAYWQNSGTFYTVRADGFKRQFPASQFIGSDGSWTILVKDAAGFSLYNGQTDAKTAAPIPASDQGWGYAGAFLGGQEGDGGPGKRAYIVPAAGGSPVFLQTPANTARVLPQELLADGRSIGSVQTTAGTYLLLNWAPDGSYTQIGEPTTDILDPVGYANDGTYAYVRRGPSSQESFVVLPGQAAAPVTTYGVPASYVVQGLSSNGRYLFAGPLNGDTPSAYEIVR